MAKRETKETYGDIKGRQDDTSNQYTEAQTGVRDRSQEESNDTLSMSNELYNTYHGLGSNTPNVQANNVSTEGFNPIAAGYGELGKTGGYSPERQASIMENVAGLKDLGKTGGFDPTSTNRIRGLGVYDEAANTGLFSDSDKANIRAKALSPISSYASNTRDQLAQQRSVQGGYAPGFDAAGRALRRDTARNISGVSLDAELGIKDRVNANRLAGAGGASNSEGNYQGLRTGNMLQGLLGAGNQEMGLQNSINSTRLAGLGGGLNTQNSIADVNTGNANRNLSAGEFNIGNQIGQEDLGISGLGGLYNTGNQNNQSDYDRSLGLIGGQANANQGYYGSRIPIATQPGIGGTVLRGIGTGAGIGASLMGDPSSSNGFRRALAGTY